MDEETQKIITEQLKQLPANIKQAIISVDYKTKLQEITKRQRLLIDQAGKLEMETTLVMIGLEPLSDYITNLQKELGLNIIRAKEVAMDVSENIFKPIRDSLRQMNEELLASEQSDLVKNTPIQTENRKTDFDTTRFTDSNETNLNRDQILSEIENPATIDGGARAINFNEPIKNITPEVKSTVLEIRPSQEIEILPGEEVKDISTGLVEAKMTGPTIVSQQIINTKPEIKLPEVKKRPSDGTDPYREATI